MEWHAVYQAAYQAALAHQQHFTQNMLLQQGQGHIAPQMAGQLYPQQASAAAQIASALAMNPGMMSNPSLLGSQNAGAAAAAAATLAMQQMMSEILSLTTTIKGNASSTWLSTAQSTCSWDLLNICRPWQALSVCIK